MLLARLHICPALDATCMSAYLPRKKHEEVPRSAAWGGAMKEAAGILEPDNSRFDA